MDICHVPYSVTLAMDVFRVPYNCVPGYGCVLLAIEFDTVYRSVTCHIVWSGYGCVSCAT